MRKQGSSILTVQGIFAAALLITYIGVLWTGGFDIASATDIARRVGVAAVEAAFWTVLLSIPLALWAGKRNRLYFCAYFSMAAAIGLMHGAQLYSLHISRNFITPLAISNANSIRYVIGARLAVVLAATVLALVALGRMAWRVRDAHAVSGRALLSAAVLLAIPYGAALPYQSSSSLEPGLYQSPVASLARSAWSSVRPLTLPEGGAADRGVCPGLVRGDLDSEYPFFGAEVPPAPLTAGTTIGAPNLIVVFSEGLSADVLGAYAGRFPDVSPNIDRLAQRSTKVVNYFNHTAASYRGLIGQNSSGFSLEGGAGKNGWASGDNTGALAAVRRDALPRILAERGYSTIFFDPHVERTFGPMLAMLGFQEHRGRTAITEMLDGDITIQDGTASLDDLSLFRGLVMYLTQMEAQPERPFYAGVYNIGTHAFIPMVKGGKAYGTGEFQFLNKVHNYDAAVGYLLDYFFSSPHAENTVLVFTADHASYMDQMYREVASPGTSPYFVDRIPLLVHAPWLDIPPLLDAAGRNSLDLAPTILHLLGVERTATSFLGNSLFEPSRNPVAVSALGLDYFVTTSAGVFPVGAAPQSLRPGIDCASRTIEAYYRAEAENRIMPPGVQATTQPLN